MEINELRLTLIERCESAKAAGVRITSDNGFGLRWDNRWTASPTGVCPLGAVLLANPTNTDFNFLEDTLSCTFDDIRAFTAGFDATPLLQNAGAYALGKEFREKYVQDRS
ncbi:MAG: hypothetical protein KGI54_13235 [Pseudomonadota bacterium]|nr:hypothetical protein [Pseudomonadota bacterium]